mgnify:FL=1
MYLAKMKLKINGVIYEKDSEVSEAMLQGVDVEYLKDMGAIAEHEKKPAGQPKSKKASQGKAKEEVKESALEKGEGDM